MDLQRIYSQAIGRVARVDIEQKSISPAADALTKQTTLDWLANPVTQKLFSSIGHDIEEDIEQAIKLAVSYPEHNNHDKIIQLLIQVNTRRKVIEQYGKAN